MKRARRIAEETGLTRDEVEKAIAKARQTK
jgi:pantoate kinase